MVEIMEIRFRDETRSEMKLRSNGELFLRTFQLQTTNSCLLLYYSMEVSSNLRMILN